MTLKLSSACILAIALASVASAQTTTAASGAATNYSQAQLKTMAREAHTSSQYQVLANYYSAQQKDYLAKSADEKKEWERRSANVMLTAAKYPRPVDSARYLYEYYTSMAQDAEEKSAKYQHLADSPSSTDAK
jgi:hypothetical protein